MVDKKTKKVAVKDVKQYNGLTNIEFKKHDGRDVIIAEATYGYDYAMIDAKELYQWLKRRYEKQPSNDRTDGRCYNCEASFF